jgi:5-methylcytosine-specific restriction endonuclease McrA
MRVVSQNTVNESPKLCTATIQGEPCGKPSRRRGLCSGHYAREREGQEMDAPWKGTGLPNICVELVEGEPCGKETRWGDLCDGHVARKKRGTAMDAPWAGVPRLCSGTWDGEPCASPAIKNGLCGTHNARRRNGTPMDAPLKILDPTRPCKGTIEGKPCDKPYSRGGYCQGHYTRLRQDTDMDAPWVVMDPTRPCNGTIQGEPCGKPYARNGYCMGHAVRMEKGKDMDAPWRITNPGLLCALDGCDRPHKAYGFCDVHKRIETSHRKRAAQVEPNGFTGERLAARISMFGRVCWICGKSIPNETGALHQDHVKPIAKGGAHTPANIRPSCPECNMSKSDAWPVDTSTAHLRLDPSRLP